MKLKVLLVSVVMLSGCTTTFGYNNLDWLVHWFVDDYVDLDSQQRQQFDEQMQQVLDWHRSTELPKYRAHLLEIQAQLGEGGLSQRQWLDHLNRIRAHWWRTRDYVVASMAPLASQLSDEQVLSMFYEMERTDRERREQRATESEQEQKDERLDELVDRMETWLGRLNEPQMQMIASYVETHQSSFAARMEYRARMQQAANELMVARFETPDFEQRLTDLLQNSQRLQGPELTRLRANTRQNFSALLANLTDSLSDYQRDHFIDELQGLINDIDDLMEGPKRGAPGLDRASTR